MSERAARRPGQEHLVTVEGFQPQQLQGVIDSLTNFGREILLQQGCREGRVEVRFFKPGARQTSLGYDASATILIFNKRKPLRVPLRLRKPDSPVKALQEFGVNFGATEQGIIVRSTPMSQELAINEEIKCAADLITCLLHYPALVTVERKGLLAKNWVPILPQGRMALKEPLISERPAKFAV